MQAHDWLIESNVLGLHCVLQGFHVTVKACCCLKGTFFINLDYCYIEFANNSTTKTKGEV